MISRSKAVNNLSYFWRPNSWICFQQFIIKAVNNLSYFMETLPQQSRGTVEGKRRRGREGQRRRQRTTQWKKRCNRTVHRERERRNPRSGAAVQHNINEQEREGSFILKKPINQNDVILKQKKNLKILM